MNKKVLLRERKRHTARRVERGMYPIQSWWCWGVPHPVMVGGTLGTPHHPDLAGWGTPGTPPPSDLGLGIPPPSRPGWGVPWVPPHHPDLAGGGTPGTPHHQTWDWVSPHHPDLAVGGTLSTPHHQTWDGVPPTIRPEMGYPLPTIQTWDGVPLLQTWDGVPSTTIRPWMR